MFNIEITYVYKGFKICNIIFWIVQLKITKSMVKATQAGRYKYGRVLRMKNE